MWHVTTDERLLFHLVILERSRKNPLARNLAYGRRSEESSAALYIQYVIATKRNKTQQIFRAIRI
jgi:hypothetical protein